MKKWHLFIMLSLTLLVRLVCLMFAEDIIDVRNYAKVGEIIANEGIFSLYKKTPGIYPYPPVWVWFEYLAWNLAQVSWGSFSVLIRLPIICADLGIVAFLWFFHEQKSLTKRYLIGLAYALNPVVLTISIFHGQFDSLMILGVLGAIYFLKQGKFTLSALWLAWGICIKIFPVLFIPLFVYKIPRAKRLTYGSIILLPLIVILLPFMIVEPQATFNQVAGYSGVALLGSIIPFRIFSLLVLKQKLSVATTALILSLSKYLFLGVYVLSIGWILRKSYHVVIAILYIIFLMFTLYAGLSPQYFIWPVALLLLLPSVYPYLIYSVGGFIAIMGIYLYVVQDLFSFPILFSETTLKYLYGAMGMIGIVTCFLLLVYTAKKIRDQDNSLAPPSV